MDTLIARKYAIIEKLMHLNEEELTELEASIAKFSKAVPQWEESMSIEQYNRELEEADTEIDRGEFYTHEEAIKRLSGWKKK